MAKAAQDEPFIKVLVFIRHLDTPYSEFEEHAVRLPPSWRDILDRPESARVHEFLRRARAFVCADGATLEQQWRKFAQEDYDGGAFLCWVLRAVDERRVEIRVEPERRIPQAVTAAEWSAAAEREVLDLVEKHGGTFDVPPPAPGGWACDGRPGTSWARAPSWPKGKRPEWSAWAETTLQLIDYARRADANGWTERARYYERHAVKFLTQLQWFEDARRGRLSSMGPRKNRRLTPADEIAAIDECRRRMDLGEQLKKIDPEVARKFGVSPRKIRELRSENDITLRKRPRARGAD